MCSNYEVSSQPPITRMTRIREKKESERTNCLSLIRFITSVLSALQSCKFIASCEDFFRAYCATRSWVPNYRLWQFDQFRPVLTSFSVVLCPIRAISVIRGQNFGCVGAALGNPRFSFSFTDYWRLLGADLLAVTVALTFWICPASSFSIAMRAL